MKPQTEQAHWNESPDLSQVEHLGDLEIKTYILSDLVAYFLTYSLWYIFPFVSYQLRKYLLH